MVKQYDVWGCKAVEGGLTQCPDEGADCFGVYERLEDGTHEWLKDFKTRELAEQWANYRRLKDHE